MKIAKDLWWLFELFAAWVPLHEEKPVKRAKRDGKAVERPLLPGLDFEEN